MLRTRQTFHNQYLHSQVCFYDSYITHSSAHILIHEYYFHHTQYHQPVMSEYQKNKKHVDGEETRRNVNIVKDCYYGGRDKDTVSALTQLFIVHCVVFRLAVMGNIEKGTVFNIL